MNTRVLITGGSERVVALLDALKGVNGIDLVGVCDVEKNSPGMEYAHKLTIGTYVNLGECISANKVDIVIETSGSKELQKTLNNISTNEVKVVDSKAAELLLCIAEENERIKKTLSESKCRLESMLNSMSEGVIALNNRLEVVLVNPAAKRFLGVKDIMLAKPLCESLRDDNIKKMIKDISSGNKESLTREATFTSNAEIKTIKFFIAGMLDLLGRQSGWIILLTDITKEKEVDKMKSEFISSISHELRTPLAAIKESVMLMLDGTTGEVNTQQKRFLNITKRNIDRLITLINDMLDISRIETGKMELKKKPCNIGALINEVLMPLEFLAKENKIELKTEAPKDIPEINCDPKRVAQVIAKLVGNAIKFTPAGGKIIVACRLSLVADKKFAEISVKDTGMGIKKKDIQKLFLKFSQLDSSLRRKPGGTGLGLAICKELVFMHGGEIWAESKPEEGSSFIFTLPVN